MTQRLSGFFRLRDRPYLITCAIAGAVLVVLAIVAVELVVVFGSGKASKTTPPRVSAVASIHHHSSSWLLEAEAPACLSAARRLGLSRSDGRSFRRWPPRNAHEPPKQGYGKCWVHPKAALLVETGRAVFFWSVAPWPASEATS